MATLYKVQSGAYKHAINATLAAASVRKKIEKYIKKTGKKEKVSVAVINSGGYYKVQEGAFESKENAEKRKEFLRDADVYSVVVETKTQDTMPAAPAPEKPAEAQKEQQKETQKPFHPRIRVIPICFFEKNESAYGDCTAILEYAEDNTTITHCILIDTAMASVSPLIISKLKKWGVKKIDAIVISHGHGDHYGGVSNIIKAFPTDTIYLPDTTELDKYQRKYGDALRRQAKKVKTSKSMKPGDWFLIGHIFCKCLFICPASKLKEHDSHYFVNNESMALMFTLDGKFKFFAAGDLSNDGNRVLLKTVAAKDLKCHIFKIQWHGDRNAILNALMKVMRPLIAYSNYHHKERKSSGRLSTRKVAEAVGTFVARNWENGDVFIDCQGDTIKATCSKGNINKTFKVT